MCILIQVQSRLTSERSARILPFEKESGYVILQAAVDGHGIHVVSFKCVCVGGVGKLEWK